MGGDVATNVASALLGCWADRRALRATQRHAASRNGTGGSSVDLLDRSRLASRARVGGSNPSRPTLDAGTDRSADRVLDCTLDTELKTADQAGRSRRPPVPSGRRCHAQDAAGSRPYATPVLLVGRDVSLAACSAALRDA